MKKVFFNYLFCLCTVLLTACNDDDVPIMPASISDLSTQKLAMESGSDATIEFSVIPEDAVFNYDTSLPECQINLEVINSSDENYHLTKVEPVPGKNGRYKATITDFKKSEKYKEQFIFVITNKDLTKIQSTPIDIYISGTSLFSFSFTKENNPGAVLKDIDVSIEGNAIQISTPFISKPLLKASFESNAEKILVNGTEQESSVTVTDFSSPVVYKVVSAHGK